MKNATFRIKKTSPKTSAAYSAVVPTLREVGTKAGFSLSAFTSRHSAASARRRLPPAFTLVELLVVVAIIAILAGVIMPTFYYAKKLARRNKAQATVKHLEIAFNSYLDNYKVWPADIADDTTYEIKDSGPPVKLFSMLRGSDPNSNPQGIAFYNFEIPTNSAMAQDNAAYDVWSDPDAASTWKAYRVMFDKNYDNKITINGQEVYRSVVVYGIGEDRTDNSGEGDDVASWK
jgi:prepilin-type N-terminal cleavage/methylation domain-containing protein